MKTLFLSLFLLLSLNVIAQFHERVLPVISNNTVNGQSVGHKTLFIISFTNNNWKTTDYILTYSEIERFVHYGGVDWKKELGWKRTDGYVPLTFNVKLDAINQAKKLSTYAKCVAFNKNVITERKQYEKETDNSTITIY